jgi:CubicO group peptidase (beta-lactamase class C family)
MIYRQLLSHQSGFAYDQLSPDLQEWSKYNKRTEWTMSGIMVGVFSAYKAQAWLTRAGWLHPSPNFRARRGMGLRMRYGLGRESN